MNCYSSLDIACMLQLSPIAEGAQCCDNSLRHVHCITHSVSAHRAQYKVGTLCCNAGLLSSVPVYSQCLCVMEATVSIILPCVCTKKASHCSS